MGKVEVKQTPRRLNPYGEKLMKIWYDDDIPPKNYVWYKDEEYYYWNGKDWEPFEFGDIESNNKHNHHKHECNCDCCESVKFEKFKKEVLAAVLKLIKSQNPDSESALLNRIQTLERDVNTLKQINHNLFVKNTELESLLESLGYIKSEDIEGLDILTGLDEKLNRFDTRISTNNWNISDLNSRLASIESSVPSRLAALENAGYITSNALNGYATEQWVENNATIPATNVSCNISGDMFDFSNVNSGLSDLVNKVEDMNNDVSSLDSRISSIEESGSGSYDDSDLRSRIESLEEMSESYATTEMIPTSVSQLDNDSGYISETYDDSELRQMIEDNELVTSASLNDLNNRVIDLNQRVSNLENEESESDEPEPEDPSEPTDYVLTYDLNGGESGPENLHSTTPTVILTDDTPSREGYSFRGWVDNNNGTTYSSGSEVTLPITLTALWAFDYPESIGVIYNMPQAEDPAELIDDDSGISYNTMYTMLQEACKDGLALTLQLPNSYITFWPQETEEEIELSGEMFYPQDGEEASTTRVYANLEHTGNQGWRFVLSEALKEDYYDEESGEPAYEIQNGTAMTLMVSSGE